jgi:hypothetical protein
MDSNFRKTYPVGGDDLNNADDSTPKLIVYAGTAGTLDGNSYENKQINIQLSSTATTTYALSNPRPGTLYTFECTGTGVNNRTITTTGCTINVTGNNTMVGNAISESIGILCVSSILYLVTFNNGAVALSTV